MSRITDHLHGVYRELNRCLAEYESAKEAKRQAKEELRKTELRLRLFRELLAVDGIDVPEIVTR